jgi:thioredoxin-related protein
MKKLILILSVLVQSATLFAQSAPDTTLPYRRYPFIPPFKLLEVDSTTFFAKADLKKDEPVLLMLFSPNCEHCQHETEEILKRINDLSKVQVVMATTMPFNTMRDFYSKYELVKFKNIKVGHDYQYRLPSFYMVHNLPYLAMYDKEGKLMTTFEGTMKIDDLIKLFQ